MSEVDPQTGPTTPHGKERCSRALKLVCIEIWRDIVRQEKELGTGNAVTGHSVS